MFTICEKDEEQTNIVSIQNSQEECGKGLDDNLNTTFKDKQSNFLLLNGDENEKKIDQANRRTEKNTNLERNNQQKSISPVDSKIYNIEIENRQSLEKLGVLNQNEQFQQENQEKQIQNNIQIIEKLCSIGTVEKDSLEVKLQRNLNSQNIIGYENYRKGFEAIQ